MHRILQPAEAWMRKACKLFHVKDADELHAALEPSSRTPDWGVIEAKRAASAKHAVKKNAKFCKCREPEKGNMISCNVCEAWFHCRCLGIKACDAPYTRLVCKDCLPCRKPTMAQCQDLMSQMGTIPVHLKESVFVAQLIITANEWMQSAAAIMAGAATKSSEELQHMCTRADLLPIELTTEINNLAQKCGIEDELPPRKQAKRTPVKTSHVCPCKDPNVETRWTVRCLRCSVAHHFDCLNVTVDEGKQLHNFVCARCQAKQPLSTLPATVSNEEVDAEEDDEGQLFCYCRTGASDDMVMCDWCSEWFHAHCLGLKAKQLKQLHHFACVRCVNLPPIFTTMTLNLARKPPDVTTTAPNMPLPLTSTAVETAQATLTTPAATDQSSAMEL
eukprot:m.254271 g.254271  ORF g.254271 m.254271 type:complete len:389 (+) comp17550_c0_seq1:3870-5036(+)